MVSHRQVARRAADPDAVSLRRVGWRLAALTVGLLCILLLVLGGAVYVTTQQALQRSLERTLEDRARHRPPYIDNLLRLDTPVSPDAQPLPGNPTRTGTFFDRSGVFFTVIDQKLVALGGLGPAGHLLVDQAGARAALREGAFCCTHQTYNQHSYLVFSQGLATPSGQVLGVVQTSISEDQYQSTLQALLQVLLIVSGLGLLASAAISGVLVRRALWPIQAALRRQRDFVADAAHELRTPLAIMRTAAELGLNEGTILDQQAALEQTLSQSAHLTRLVDALSLLARADSGVLTLERHPLDLARLTVETISGVAILAEEHDIALQVNAPAETCVLGDAGRLRQLLLILLDNALKHTPEGGTITVQVERTGGRVRLHVRDSGAGIDPADLPHLFNRFYRADRARSGEGMGLGLSIGHWITEAHGGNIAATNAPVPDHGAVFTVTLPLAP